ncbi:hypothetical protein [Spirulina sp. 06S082]|uniref:hypothetical protein n=1 Tax=Spirulina sp. 06S082 TaxID=3110248 RepID=UPI002B2024E1|nr:hypothetical protein [Spirulina sp. 06S082]MEA5470920.1 hypothetical protein [Spirulina sp. 06S082]
MSRATQISNIIEKRKPQAENSSLALEKLDSLFSIVKELEVCRDRTCQRIEDIFIREKLKELHFEKIYEKIRDVEYIIQRLYKRFSRKTLTIAFVGRAGQGKSRFIQSLTGLTKAEVPDGGIENCTGVKCTISHVPETETYGEVYFHNRDSFLEQNILPYYEFLGLENKPNSLQDFIDSPLPEMKTSGSEVEAYYGHLQKCHQNYTNYQEFLQEVSPRRIARGDIRQFVAQTDENNQRNLFSYLTVKEVNVFCTFPQDDVGQIQLIDLPGLGDTVLGDKERIRQSLGQDVDFALFIYMPQGRILQEGDYKLYDIANDALTELPIAKWSFMILNQVVSSQAEGIATNLSLCNTTKKRIEDEQRIKVRACLIADCANKEVAGGVLDEVLKELDENLRNLDNEYASVGNIEIKNLQADLNQFINKAKQAFSVAPTLDETRNFRRLFESFTRDITKELRTLLRQIEPMNLDVLENDKDADFFRATLNQLLVKCNENTGIPTKEDVLNREMDIGTGAFPAIFASYLDEIRTHIRSHFSSVDNGLKEYVDSVKQKVAECFTEKTELGNLTPLRGTEFLKFMAEEIPASEQSLKGAFSRLYSFEMSYRTNFQYRILKALEDLHPNRSAKLLSTRNDKTDLQIAESICNILQALHQSAICNIEEALEKFQGEPSLAVYAAVDEFVDEIVRSRKARDRWYDFLRERSSQIWSDEFGQKVKEERKEWIQLIDKAINANRFDFI